MRNINDFDDDAPFMESNQKEMNIDGEFPFFIFQDGVYFPNFDKFKKRVKEIADIDADTRYYLSSRKERMEKK